MERNVILHSKPTLDQSDTDMMMKVIESGHLEEGQFVQLLENEFKTNFESKYAVSVSNGFAAIHLSLIALGIGKGDEVIIPSYACAALLNPILLLGAQPIIADIDSASFNLSVSSVRNKLSKHTKAIIVPHTFGFPAPIDEIVAMGIPVIEDCAHSIGGEFKGKKLGSFGTLAVFSFYASKMICSGDGGMIITDDEKLNEIILNYRYYGHKKLHKFVAYNYHLTNLPAALASSQMNRLPSFIERRKQIASIYDSTFAGNSHIKINFDNKSSSCYYRYPVRLNGDIELIKRKMNEFGIQCGYGVLEGMHQMLDLDARGFPNTENNLKSILSLPIYPDLSDEDTLYIAENLIKLME